MKVATVCLRCHQKCHLTAEVADGWVVGVADAFASGTPPCREACPLGMDVAGYVAAAARGKFSEALEIIRQTNPLPRTCARICHHPCESECNRLAIDDPVAIRGIKRLVMDRITPSEDRPPSVTRTGGQRVAVIGSGPAGLTAAHDLAVAGCGVTVYEKAPVAGGVPATVIPDFILPAAVVQADVDYIRALGVEIRTGAPVGGERALERLLSQYHAVLVAVGCQSPRRLAIPGSDLDGVHQAFTFLERVKQDRKESLGKRVVIIGGGNTALAAARTALRLDARQVHLACLEPRHSMPAYAWEIAGADKEGVRIHPALAPQRLQGRDNRVIGVDFRKVESVDIDSAGNLEWTLCQGRGSECFLEADAVIVATGQTTRLAALGGGNGLKCSPQGTLVVDPATMACDGAGLFAAGDAVAGAGTVVDGMAAGRRAAASIIEYLGGGTGVRHPAGEKSVPGQGLAADFTGQGPRRKMPAPASQVARRSFEEVARGYSASEGMAEAGRCLQCATACPKGMTIPDVMYHPQRLLYPLRRSGRRGGGAWERISWQAAIGEIAGRLKEIKERYGPQANAISCGSGEKHIGVQALAIAKKLWPTSNTHWGRYTCETPDDMNNGVTFGDLITYEFGPDYEHARCIVFWGANPNVGTPAQTRAVYRALRNGARVIVIDPRPIPMVAKAALWLRIRPGTDAALALAMMNVIIAEGLYDRAFVGTYCSGFEPLRDHVRDHTPAWAAEVTGLAADEIVRAARMYATTKPGAVYVRLGSGAQQVNSTQTSRAISLLIALCGNVDVPGGNLLYYRTYRDALFWHIYDMGKGIKGPADVEDRRIGAARYPLMHKEAICDMPGLIRAMEDGGVRSLWCLADNLVVAEMDSRRIWEILQKRLEFFFVSDFFMTPTAELADIVLPAAFYTEIDTLVAAFMYPSNYVTASKRVVAPPGECRDDREVAIEIARRMGSDVSPWESVPDFLDWRLKYLGLTFDELCARPDGRITFPRRFRRYETSRPAFQTASGKVELYSSVFEALGLNPLPVYREPPQSPASAPGLVKAFPLVYTHYRLPSYMHSEGRQIERQRRLEPYPYLEMNTQTALSRGIAAGDWVYLETPANAENRRLQYKVRLVDEMHPDVVAGPHGWWFPERPGPEHGCFESNINAVLSLDPPYDPVVGNVQCRAFPCRVRRADEQPGL